MRSEQAGLVILVADGTEVSTDDFKVGVLANVVLCHLEHAEMEVGDRAEGATCDQDYGLLLSVAERPLEAVSRESVVWRVCERFWRDVGAHGWRAAGVEMGRGRRA